MSMIGIEAGQPLRREARFDVESRAASPAHAEVGHCPDCGSRTVEICQKEAAFFAVCTGCAERGPDRQSVYEALMDWRRRTGAAAPGMVRSLRHIVMALVVSAAAIGVSALIFG